VQGPRRDTRGIIDARELFARVRFRRRMPCAQLQPYLEHYWLIDGQLDAPYTSHVVPHPSVNVVFERGHAQPEIAGVGLGLFSRVLDGRIRVAGVQFRPGGFRPFRAEPVSEWTGRHVRLDAASSLVLDVEDEDERVAALDAFLLSMGPVPDPQATLAMELVQRIRDDREIRRVADFARDCGVAVRTMQRLFADYVGVSPKWVIPALPHPRGARTRRVGRGVGTSGRRPRVQRPGPPRAGLHADRGRLPHGVRAGAHVKYWQSSTRIPSGPRT
jgi:hypothetical protein